MRSLSLLWAATFALIFIFPADTGSAQTRYNFNQQSAPPPPKRKKNGPPPNAGWQELRALQMRKECRMYAFRYWRYHPDYRHCRYN